MHPLTHHAAEVVLLEEPCDHSQMIVGLFVSSPANYQVLENLPGAIDILQ
jgi:hypothetical protein